MTRYSAADQYQLEAGIPQSQTEIIVLVEEENPFIESAYCKKSAPLHEQAGTRNERDDMVTLLCILCLIMRR